MFWRDCSNLVAVKDGFPLLIYAAFNGDRSRQGISPLGVFLLIIALVSVLAVGPLFLNAQGSSMNGQQVGEVPYSTFYQQIQAGNVMVEN